MNTSRIKFVLLFLVCAFAFILGSTELLNQSPEAIWGSASQSSWQYIASIILSPVRIILMGPLLPFIAFLSQDPDAPPPFYLIGFAFYWTILAVVIHYFLYKRKHAS